MTDTRTGDVTEGAKSVTVTRTPSIRQWTFPFEARTPRRIMGFGSYDESEQRDLDADFDDDDAVESEESSHNGEIEFENGASSDELIERLKDIKDEE